LSRRGCSHSGAGDTRGQVRSWAMLGFAGVWIGLQAVIALPDVSGRQR
jgi:hypothetical protein